MVSTPSATSDLKILMGAAAIRARGESVPEGNIIDNAVENQTLMSLMNATGWQRESGVRTCRDRCRARQTATSNTIIRPCSRDRWRDMVAADLGRGTLII